MSIVSVTELFDDHDGEVTIDGHRWERAFHVLTDDRTQWGPDIILAVDSQSGIRIPHIGEPLKVDSGGFGADDIHATVQRLRPQRVAGTPYLWKVIAEYSTRAMDTPGEIIPNPLERPPEWSWGDIVTTEEYTHDADGVPVLNTALEPYDPGLTREVTSATLTLTWNVSGFDPIAAATYFDTVNESAFTVLGLLVAKGIAKVAHNTASGPHIEGSYAPYMRRTVELQFRKMREVQWHDGTTKIVSGWDDTPLSMGFQGRVNLVDEHGNQQTDMQLAPIFIYVIDEDGNKTDEKVRPQEPVALDHIGRAIEDDRPAHVQHYKPYKRRDFSGLQLPE